MKRVIMASYPRGDLLDFPFPYYTEIMTGFEYSTAAHMIYEGQVDAGLKVYNPSGTATMDTKEILSTKGNTVTVIPGPWLPGRASLPIQDFSFRQLKTSWPSMI